MRFALALKAEYAFQLPPKDITKPIYHLFPAYPNSILCLRTAQELHTYSFSELMSSACLAKHSIWTWRSIPKLILKEQQIKLFLIGLSKGKYYKLPIQALFEICSFLGLE